MTGAAMGKGVACEYAFDGGHGWYGPDGEFDQVFLNGPWAAWECVVVEGKPHHLDDLLDVGTAEGFCGHGCMLGAGLPRPGAV